MTTSRVLQIEQYSREDLLTDFETVINKITGFTKCDSEKTGKITVLNRKQAAKALDISFTFFDKLTSKGIIPTTVDAGVNPKTGKRREMWALHHLLQIRHVIQALKYHNDADKLIEAKHIIKQTLGI